MSDVISLILGPFPWALVNGDGALRKMNKASLARQKQVLPAETIIDGMSLCSDDEGQ